ncbi:centriolar and ciliogenesis-associated protein HYLS1 isoform 4-T6 [Spinachia spinachia]
MDNLDFSEEEIREQLSALGYKNIPKHRLCAFKQDLDELVRRGEWKSFASPAGMNGHAQPSPPAFTKEKVGPCYFENSGHGFFLHSGHVEHDRQVISFEQQRRCDSYARHSVALNPGPPHGAPARLQVEEEPDPDESLHPALTDSFASTPDSHRGRYIKRKVLRKHEGQSLVCDESVYSEEASGLEERLAGLHLSSSGQSSETDRVSFSALESYIGGLTRSRSDGDLRPKPKSFIRPAMSQQTIKKTDPVAKYFKYKQLWETFTLPGDGDRRSLRSELKERLAYQPPAPKPRRTYVPNSYVVPTEKKRSALRWELRNDLASGLLPHAFRFQP